MKEFPLHFFNLIIISAVNTETATKDCFHYRLLASFVQQHSKMQRLFIYCHKRQRKAENPQI